MTTNPWLIMAINMTVVFAVLISLGILMQIVYWIDPTKKKLKKTSVATPTPSSESSVATPTVTTNDEEVIAAIVGAVVAMGYSSHQIASIRPIISKTWRMDGRLSGRN